MRFLSLALLSVSTSAMASFDLILVADSGQSVVHRYDGDSGTYLGKFGEGTLGTVRGVMADKATQTAYVAHSNGYSAFNYNTGEHLYYNDRTGSSTHDFAIGSNGFLMTAHSNVSSTVIRWFSGASPASPFFNVTTSSGAGSMTSIGTASDGRKYGYNVTLGQLIGWASNGLISDQLVTYGTATGISKGAVRGDEMVMLSAGGNTRRITLPTGTAFAGGALTNPFTTSVEFDFGHEGDGWGLGTNASGTRLQRYAKTIGGAGNFYDAVGPGRTLSQVTTPVGMSVVTAPEPGTLIALGAGALALLRRRRK